jgi:DNA-binding transcriptional MerR regulator
MQNSSTDVPIYNVDALAKKAGVTRRTIHYYLQRGLLPRPEGGGRGYYYTEAHLERLRQIQEWREQGVPLENMKAYFSEAPSRQIQSAPPYSVSAKARVTDWSRLNIDTEIEIHFRPGVLSRDDQEAIKEFILLRIKK